MRETTKKGRQSKTGDNREDGEEAGGISQRYWLVSVVVTLGNLVEKEGGEKGKANKKFSTNSADLHLCRNFPIHGFVRQIESFLLVVLGGVLSGWFSCSVIKINMTFSKHHHSDSF